MRDQSESYLHKCVENQKLAISYFNLIATVPIGMKRALVRL